MHVTLRGGLFFYTETGDTSRLPVIFIHGFPFSSEMWGTQLEAAGRNYHAIAYDVRGHGKSSVGDGQYTVEGHVDDLLTLMDHLHVNAAVVVGLSMGGYIALRALEKSPDRFCAAVLCDTRSEADSNEAKLKRYASITLVKQKGSESFAEGFLPLLFAEESFKRCPEAVAMIRRIISRTPPLSIAGTLLALAGRTDTTGALAQVRVPTLILTGELDTITPPSSAQALHERIPHSELFLVPQAAHMSNLENPDFFNEKLLFFLKKIATDRPTR
jgi:pimeloyl-ACP methyl ester carboxylesterase